MPQTTDLTAQPPAADRPPGAAKSGAKNPAKKTRNADATRDEILVAATREFAEKGLFGARVEEIAARTAASKHMIYYYFGSKDGLYSAVLEQAYADFRKAEAAIEYDTLGPVAAMEALVSNTFASHVGNPHVIRIIMSENLDSGRHVSQMANVAQRELVLDTKADKAAIEAAALASEAFVKAANGAAPKKVVVVPGRLVNVVV